MSRPVSAFAVFACASKSTAECIREKMCGFSTDRLPVVGVWSIYLVEKQRLTPRFGAFLSGDFNGVLTGTWFLHLQCGLL
jgi:hypothetical protein